MTLTQMRGFSRAAARIHRERIADLSLAVRAGVNADAKEFAHYIDMLQDES